MGKAYKVIVTGAFNSGKTALVTTISEIPVVSTERRITDEHSEIKEETTVAMDYGQVTINGNLLHLFGTPGQERFDFMWDILSREADALLIMIDSANRTNLTTTRRMLRQLRRKAEIPFLVVATKQDLRRALSPQEIAESLPVDPSRVVACDAREKGSVKAVLEELSKLLG
ncbi:MAG: GTP-binding protein [Anaerolineae bacterium]|nr:GTP-binding protein [Anaerolineae bacterium]